MSKQNKKNRKERATPVEVLNSLTRENILGYINEREELASQLQKVEATISAMKAANLPDDAIENVRSLVQKGSLERLSYLESIIRRVALVMVRSEGFKNLQNIVMNNIEKIPTAAEKQNQKLPTFSEHTESLEV